MQPLVHGEESAGEACAFVVPAENAVVDAVMRDFAGQLATLTERLAAMEGRLSHMEEAVERSLAVVLPKVESLLRTMEQPRASAPSAEQQMTVNEDETSQEHTDNNEAQDIPWKCAFAVAASGDLVALLRIIEQNGRNVAKVRNSRGDTALHTAAAAGQVGALEILLDATEDGANLCGWHLRTPLHVAAAAGQIDAVLSLLSSGALADAADAKGTTPLHLAAENGRSDVTALLLVEGAAPHIADEVGRVPLHYAAANGHTSVTSALLQHQGSEDADVMDMRAVTPIMLAAFHGHMQTVRVLLQKGATLEATDADGRTALHHAALGPDDNEGQTVTLALLEAGACVDASDVQGRTPLWEAARCGHTSILRSLLEAGASANAYNAAGISPLETASAGGHGSTVTALLRGGAPSDDQQLHRALAVAVSAEVVWSLASAAPGAVRNTGGHALWQAVRNNRPAVVAALLDVGVSHNVPSEEETRDDDSGACCGGQNSVDLGSSTLLHEAADLGFTDCVSALLARGAMASAETNSTTPMHLAADGGHVACLNVLLSSGCGGALVNKCDAEGNTPLHLAAEKGHLQCVAALLAAGSDPYARNALGRVPKGLQDRHDEVANLLRGAAVYTNSTSVNHPIIPLNI